MLNAVVFIADPKLAGLLRGLAGTATEFNIDTIVELTTAGYWVARAVSTSEPDVILVEMTDAARDLALAASIRQQSPGVPLIGLASREVQLLLERSPSPDLAAAVAWPFTVRDLEDAISIAVHQAHREIYENLVALLPGKAGSGASTVVLHTARVAAQQLKKRVLVMEGDLHSGLLAAMLRVGVKTTIRDALADAARPGSLTWTRYVVASGGADFLLTDTAVKEPVPAWTHYYQLLRLVAQKYDLMMMDLPEVINTATAEVVRRARAIYVVSTPEFPSLKLAQQRSKELDQWGVDRARVFGLLNRGHKNDMNAKEAEKILGCPVVATFPNDYKSIRRQITEGGSIDVRSNLGQSYVAFSRILTGVERKAAKSFWR